MSNLYMTTEEFAAMIVDTLDDQNYFKKGTKNHPADIVAAFVTTAETIGAAMEWAIDKQSAAKLREKLGVMSGGNLKKNEYSRTHTLPEDDEIAPALLEQEESLITPKDALEYSEWKMKGYL
jgi:hypothetical protein